MLHCDRFVNSRIIYFDWLLYAEKAQCSPENKANLLNSSVSWVTVFNVLSLLMRRITSLDVCPMLNTRWASLTLGHIWQYEDIDVWWINEDSISGIEVVLFLMPQYHAYHLNEDRQTLSAQMQLILCLSLLLSIFQAYGSLLSPPLHFWIDEIHMQVSLLTQACFVSGLVS